MLLAEFDECMVECDGRLCDTEREVGVQNPHRGGARGFMVKYVTVGRKKEMTVTFRDGTEIQA